jgi:hypothetical protein
MATTKAHALDIFVQDDVLIVQAYRLGVSGTDFVRTGKKSGRPLEIAMKSKANRETIAYILDSEEWDTIRTYWEGYFNKEFSTYLTIGDVPDRVRKWVDRLPEYEIKIGGN